MLGLLPTTATTYGGGIGVALDTEGKTWFKRQDLSGEQNEFKYGLLYQNVFGDYTNGNIAAMSWQHAQPNGSAGVERNYGFGYDGLNRLLGATGSGNEEKGLSYDLNGNLKTLQRTQNNVQIDNLSYNYQNGNRLNKIDDSSGSNEGFKEVIGLLNNGECFNSYMVRLEARQKS